MSATAGAILAAMLGMLATGAALVGYVLWSRKRRMDRAIAEAAAAAAQAQRNGNGGGGGPTEPA